MRSKVFLVALLAFVFSSFVAGPSASATTPEGSVGVQWVGRVSSVNQPATLYQCPAFHCNQGQAYPGQALAALCWWPGDSQWNWVVNHSNGHTGYVRSEFLTTQANVSCASYGRGTRVQLTRVELLQCPASQCNKGEAYSSQDVTTVCHWDDAPGTIDLVHNHANGHVGFVASRLLTEKSETKCGV